MSARRIEGDVGSRAVSAILKFELGRREGADEGVGRRKQTEKKPSLEARSSSEESVRR